MTLQDMIDYEKKESFDEGRKEGIFAFVGLAKELNLSAEQQKNLFPIYDKMEDEIFKVTSETRQLEKKVSSGKVTDLEYENAARAITELKQKECAIELKYFDQLKAILSSQQLFLLKKAERKFSHQLMKMRNKGKKKDK